MILMRGVVLLHARGRGLVLRAGGLVVVCSWRGRGLVLRAGSRGRGVVVGVLGEVDHGRGRGRGRGLVCGHGHDPGEVGAEVDRGRGERFQDAECPPPLLFCHGISMNGHTHGQGESNQSVVP